MTKVELIRIIKTEHGHQLFFLKEIHGERGFPIMTGIHEILMTEMALHEFKPARPSTHWLTWNIIQALNGNLHSVTITDLVQEIYHATINIGVKSPKEKTIEIDCRPSDAIVLATIGKLPIYVCERVFEKLKQEV